MALKDRLGNAPKRTHGTPCSVGALEDHLTGEEADSFYAMLHTLGWSGRRVYEEMQEEARELRAAAQKLREAGKLDDAEALEQSAKVHADMGQQTVNRHRSRGCRCFS